MSFDIVCSKCGAPSSPSTGICPFCKTPFESKDGPHSPTLDLIKKKYEEGALSEAMSLAQNSAEVKPEFLDDTDFLMLFAKIHMETEGPDSKINALLSRILVKDPGNTQALEYLDVMTAKSHLAKGRNDPGEIELQRILRRSPDNMHALFLLGTHMYWNNGDLLQAARYLERVNQLRPNFLRSWACLGAIYAKLNNKPLSSSAFRKCVALENNPQLKKFFEEQLTK